MLRAGLIPRGGIILGILKAGLILRGGLILIP